MRLTCGEGYAVTAGRGAVRTPRDRRTDHATWAPGPPRRPRHLHRRDPRPRRPARGRAGAGRAGRRDLATRRF
ncbi:hypothetical protein ACN6LL_003523, partial [Streptomyces violaceoruber]